jgi:hypothetical protein
MVLSRHVGIGAHGIAAIETLVIARLGIKRMAYCRTLAFLQHIIGGSGDGHANGAGRLLHFSAVTMISST